MNSSDTSRSISLSISKPDYCLYGFLLDSVEGLARHSYDEASGCMIVYVQSSQAKEFDKFSQAWADFVEHSAGNSEYQYGTY